MESHSVVQLDPPTGPAGGTARRPPRIVKYAWIILKNVIGWILILCSGAVGLASPGPFGVPLFFIGFALITFPGKRGLTARVLKGKSIPRGSRPFRRWVAAVALLAPAVSIFYLNWKYGIPGRWTRNTDINVGFIYAVAALLLWFGGLQSLHLINRGLKFVPAIRRRIRPWMRRKGIDLLPRADARAGFGPAGR